MTAKANFDNLILTSRTMPETTKSECETKIGALQLCNVTFAIGWLIFWWFFGFGIGFIICLIIGFSNNSKRNNFKNQEIGRLQLKISNLVDAHD